MGSGSVRKSTDRPLIRTPKGTGGGEGGGTQQIADVCLPSFEVKLEGVYVTGKKLTLDTKKERCSILLDGKKIVELNSSQSLMVQRCEAEGVVYSGVIFTDKKGQHYARFHRSSS